MSICFSTHTVDFFCAVMHCTNRVNSITVLYRMCMAGCRPPIHQAEGHGREEHAQSLPQGCVSIYIYLCLSIYL